ncbi:DUF2934 domain-containing protein [Azospirillum agricola]|uniref:DUF2934 domain-containing protein n=1 Tax=Azospirillum agricola TaxID=1720247 RepID=UPI000A0F1665|nr:DUF2934 domain-containing protein [Azospirillum agricola]SMH54573.1 Protein of unknown function [Azospirillum lipoferum]
MDEDSRIRARAHDLWERDGRPDNRHQEHWAQAEREIAEEEAVNGPGAGIQVPDNASTRVLREAAEHIAGKTES